MKFLLFKEFFGFLLHSTPLHSTPQMDFSLSLTPHPRHSNLASPLLYSLGLCTLSSNELVAQHSQSSKRLRELKNSLLLVIQLLRFFNGNVLAVVEKKEFPLVVLDPYVKDSRCQIQAIFVHFALSWLWKEEGRCTWDTGELLMWESELEKVDDVLSLPQAKRSLEILGLLEVFFNFILIFFFFFGLF